MQRRAAAIAAAFFLVVAAGAYVYIGVVTEPAMDVPADEELAAGDALEAGGLTYAVDDVTGDDAGTVTANVTWTNESDRYTAVLEINSTVPAAAVEWADQRNRHTATLENGSTVTVAGNRSRVEIAAGDDPRSATLVGLEGAENVSVEPGGELVYGGNATTVTSITSEAIHLAWGDPYRVLVPAAEEPQNVTFRQDLNVTRLLAADPEAESVLRGDGGVRYVRYRNGSTAPLSSFLPEPEVETVDLGATLAYLGNDTTVETIGAEEVTLAWTAPRTFTRTLEEGGTVTLGDTQYVVHFPDDGTLALTTDQAAYDEEVARQEYFGERQDGLWAVTSLSTIAAFLLLALAYVPSRY